MNRLPGEVWAMTPSDTLALIGAWNDAQEDAAGKVAPMTMDELDALMRQYPDG